MLNKILMTVCVILMALCGWLGYQKYDMTQTIHTLETDKDKLEIGVKALQAQVDADAAQRSFKEKELAQTNDLLNTCYRALSGQIEDFEEINRILQLPQKERGDECNPDQDSACLDFLNRQLLDVH